MLDGNIYLDYWVFWYFLNRVFEVSVLYVLFQIWFWLERIILILSYFFFDRCFRYFNYFVYVYKEFNDVQSLEERDGVGRYFNR